MIVCDENDTIKTLKEKIEVKTNIKICDQLLTFDDKILSNNSPIKKYGLSNECTIFLYYEKRGG